MFPSGIVKLVIPAAVAKGIVVAALVLALIHHHNHLSTFEQGLIIATVSAVITGVFTLFGSWLAVRASRPVHDDVLAMKEKMEDGNK